jgi:hypothetical protein
LYFSVYYSSMFKNFLIKKMFKAQGVSDDQIDMILGMMEKNPQLFETIAKETEEKIKSGMDKQMAAMSVMKKYEEELKKLK